MNKIKNENEETLSKLLEILDVKEEEIKKNKMKKQILIENIIKMKDENKIFKNNIFQLQNEVLIKSKEIFLLNEKLFKLLNNNLNDKKSSFNIIDTLKNQIENKEYTIELKNFNIESKNETIKTVRLDNTFINNENNQLKVQIDNLKNENLKLKSRIIELENKLDDIYIERKSESSLIIENEHLKYDNIRLLNILKSTKEYQNFNYLKEDYLANPIIYIGSSHHPSNINSTTTKISKKKEQEIINQNKNNYNWIHLPIYNKVKELFEKFEIVFNRDCVNEILQFINSIWIERENNLLLSINNKNRKEKEEIRRKKNYTKSFSEIKISN